MFNSPLEVRRVSGKQWIAHIQVIVFVWFSCHPAEGTAKYGHDYRKSLDGKNLQTMNFASSLSA